MRYIYHKNYKLLQPIHRVHLDEQNSVLDFNEGIYKILLKLICSSLWKINEIKNLDGSLSQFYHIIIKTVIYQKMIFFYHGYIDYWQYVKRIILELKSI